VTSPLPINIGTPKERGPEPLPVKEFIKFKKF
jgi:hypothetical protein